MRKKFHFGQAVKYDGHNGTSIILGPSAVDCDGKPTEEWWNVATPLLPCILTHAKNIERLDENELTDEEIERLVKMPVGIVSPYGGAIEGMSDRQKDCVRLFLKHVRDNGYLAPVPRTMVVDIEELQKAADKASCNITYKPRP